MLDLARKLKRLEAFVYVSTAFSFSPHRVIGERVYQVPVSAEELIEKMVDGADFDERWHRFFIILFW